MEYFGYIVLSLAILLVMVLIHELGHYTTAKILGFTINEFSVGFGPKLFSKRRKNGEIFSLRAVPLGGFCAFLGEDEDAPERADGNADKASEKADNPVSATDASTDNDRGKDEDLLSYVMRAKIEDDEKSKDKPKPKEENPIRLDKNGNPAKTFNEQKPWKRIIVLLGGVAFNLLSAIIFSLIYIWSVGYAVPIVADVYYAPDGAAYSEFEKGDIILAVNGKDITVMRSFAELTEGLAEGDGVTVKVDRSGKIIEFEARRQKITHTDEDGKTTDYVGFGISTGTEFTGNNAGNAFKYCVPYTFKLSWSILGSFGGIITGRIPITSVSGPVGSIKMMADVSIANWRNILILLPLLASNLAMFNILPIPALDGCRVIFTVIEWVRKKPLNRKVEAMINFVGLIVLLLFVVIVDILSFAL